MWSPHRQLTYSTDEAYKKAEDIRQDLLVRSLAVSRESIRRIAELVSPEGSPAIRGVDDLVDRLRMGSGILSQEAVISASTLIDIMNDKYVLYQLAGASFPSFLRPLLSPMLMMIPVRSSSRHGAKRSFSFYRRLLKLKISRPLRIRLRMMWI